MQVLTGQATRREAADAAEVERSTVVHICRVAKVRPRDPARRTPSAPSATPEVIRRPLALRTRLTISLPSGPHRCGPSGRATGRHPSHPVRRKPT